MLYNSQFKHEKEKIPFSETKDNLFWNFFCQVFTLLCPAESEDTL